MTDDQDPLSVPAQWHVTEEAADARDGLPPAFPARIGLFQVLAPVSVQAGHGHPGALPVVTFPQPPVMEHRDLGLAKGNDRGLGRASQVGAEHRGDPVARAPIPQLTRLRPAPLRESAGPPAGGESRLVVLARRMGLKYQLDGHQPSLRTAPGKARAGTTCGRSQYSVRLILSFVA